MTTDALAVPQSLFNLALVHEAVTAAVPDRTLVVWRDRRLTYAAVAERSRRLASYLHGRGLRCHTERARLAGHEVGQDVMGIYAYNGNEWLEAMIGGYRARVAPFNVNYRYVRDELVYLLNDAEPSALVYHARFAPQVAEIREAQPRLRVLLQVADDSDHPLLPDAIDYEEALATSDPAGPPVEPSPDDLYILYTGGTTGMPKGVLWRQHDIFIAAMGGRQPPTWQVAESISQIAHAASTSDPYSMMVLLPLMHGGGQWAAFHTMCRGGTIVFPDVVDRFDAADVLRTIERERVAAIVTVGDAMAKPIVDEFARGSYDVSSLVVVNNGAAPLSPATKQRLIDCMPHVMVADGAGASETGSQMHHVSTKDAVATGTFKPSPTTMVLNEDMSAVHEPGHDGIGWLAERGCVPLGYKGDAEKTANTFPTIAGDRYAVPGDRARLQADGSIQLLGRDAVTINTGGEKVFAEEVEMALASHPAVGDVVITARPSERWGSEVVAIVALAPGATASEEQLVEHAAKTLARYKLPKAFVFRPDIVRSPSGKADYRWAREQAKEPTAPT